VKRRLSPRALYAVAGGILLVYALFGWFVLVGPKRSEAARLQEELVTTEAAVAAARVAATRKNDAQPIAVADIFRVAKAMPSVPDMPGILLELARLAEESGIEFKSITPQVATAEGAFQRIPISLSFDGSFYELSDFLFRLRTLVGVRSSELHATGRLFAVSTVGFEESPRGFPDLSATLTVDAFVYGTETPATTGAPAGTDAEAPESEEEPPVPAAPTNEAAPAEGTP
jgi:type IV pilus assembly protein PilO